MGNKGYQVKEVTPKGMRCMAGPCPEVYEVKSASPQEMGCLAGPCPELYSVGEDYLIVGRAVSLEEAREVRLDKDIKEFSECQCLADFSGEDYRCREKRLVFNILFF